MDIDNVIKNVFTEDTDFNKKCSFISENIISGDLSLVSFIEKLDFLLADTDPEKRQLGVNILAEVLGKLPNNLLSPQQVELISTFFISKLKDHHMVIPPTIKGILFIVKLKNYPPSHVAILLTTMTDNIACQQQQQNDRYNIYKLFEALFENFNAELISMGLNFTYGIISSIDGERDPRNLLFLFNLMGKYLKIIPLGHLVEDMFEVFACYFPVDFRTPLNNATITRENLAEALTPCLCAVPEFGEACIQLALEKLDSSLEIAKTDSLDLLIEGCKVFSAQIYLENGYKIWSQLQKEIFITTNSKFQHKCLETLTHIIKKTSEGFEDEFKNFLVDVVDTLKGNMLPELKQYEPSVLILLHIARGSPISSTIVNSQIVPILANTFSIASDIHKPKILRILVAFIKTYLDQNNLKEAKELNSVLTLSFESIRDQNNDLRKEVFTSFKVLTPYLSEDTRKMLNQEITRYIVTSDCYTVKDSFDNCLLELSKHYSDEIKEIVSKLTVSDSLSLDVYVSSVTKLADVHEFREFVVEIYIKYINESTESSCVVIRNINKLLAKKESDIELTSVFIQKNFVGILLEFSVNHISNPNVREILLDVASVIKILIGGQDSLTQNTILNHWFKKLCDGLEREESFVIVLSGLLTRLNRDVEIERELISKLLSVAVKGEDKRNKEVAAQLLGNIINKMDNDETFDEYVQMLKSKCDECKTFLPLFWITKALVIRNHSEGLNWVSMLFEKLDELPEAAEGFKIIMDDTYDCFATSSRCIKKPLYQQKIFGYVVQKILSNFSQDIKSQYLKAFGYVLGYSPHEVILLNFKKISRLVLLTLEHSDDGEIILILLQTVKNVITNNKDEIIEQLEDYVNRILKLTQFENSMKVRLEAIRFINSLLTTAPLYKLMPIRRAVLEQLAHCVDDRKRLVRKEAMEARALWFLLDSPMD